MHGKASISRFLTKKTALALVILFAVGINFQIFYRSYPQTFGPQTPELARDFSAYYIGAWRLFHNPTAVYCDGVQPGDCQIAGEPQTFRYPPCFLLLFAPFLTISYQDAFNAFNIIQFLSIFALAFFVFRLTEDKPLTLASVVAVIVLVNPLLFLPSLCGSYSITGFLHYRIVSLHLQTISPSYYAGYLLGNAHILQNTLIVGALYFGYVKKPWLSALMFTFGALDPRAALFSLPLLMWYNRGVIRKFVAGSAIFLTAANLPFFFYHGVGFALFQSNFRASINLFDFIVYDYIPIFSVASIGLLEMGTIIYNQRTQLTALQTAPVISNVSISSGNDDIEARLEKAMRRTELLTYAAIGLAIAILAAIIGVAFLR
ncbi:MAG: hypothetical protein NWE98_00655 [Candidatus Bathyarchaeota archaeon]|nr:hypothetical protein [Candidatus Bathyarchaeota archaeon]